MLIPAVYRYDGVFARRQVELCKPGGVHVDLRAAFPAGVTTRRQGVVAGNDVTVATVGQAGLQSLGQRELLAVKHDKSAITASERYSLHAPYRLC